MWETPFEEWMLGLQAGVVVLCPTEEAFSEMAKILDKNHIRFGTGSASDNLRFWNAHKEDTCYYIRRGYNLLYGPTSSAYDREYSGYTKCTFYGLETSEFESADDKEMCDFLGF